MMKSKNFFVILHFEINKNRYINGKKESTEQSFSK